MKILLSERLIYELKNQIELMIAENDKVCSYFTKTN